MKKPELMIATLMTALASHAQVLLPTDIAASITAHGSSPTYTTSDTLLSIEGFAASSVPANLTVGGGSAWFGVEANGAFDNADTLKLTFAPGAGWTGFGDIYSRAVLTISGFTADPGFNGGAFVNSASYASGIETINLAYDGGTVENYSFANATASAGQTLTVSMDASTAPQLAVTGIDYSAVPEPAASPLLLLSGLALTAVRRRLLS